MMKLISKLNNYLFPKVIGIELNKEQKDAHQSVAFEEDSYLEKKEKLKAKLALYQHLPDWNPLKEIRFDTVYENEDICFLSDTIISRVEQDPFFKQYCSIILQYLILYVSKIPNQNALALDYIYSLIINTKNIADLFIKIGFSSASERESLEKWHQVPNASIHKLALCLEPYVRKKYSDNIVSLI